MKRMESFIKILLMIGIVIYCLTGCMNDYVDSVFNQSDKEEEILEMTDEEKELLNLHVELSKSDPAANPLSPDKMQTDAVKDLRSLVSLSEEILKSLNK